MYSSVVYCRLLLSVLLKLSLVESPNLSCVLYVVRFVYCCGSVFAFEVSVYSLFFFVIVIVSFVSFV